MEWHGRERRVSLGRESAAGGRDGSLRAWSVPGGGGRKLGRFKQHNQMEGMTR